MLRLITNDDIKEIISYCSGDSIGVKIASQLLAYSNRFDFLNYWVQQNDKGYTCAISRFDGNMTVYASDEADFEEIGEFIRAVGYASIFTKKDILIKMGFEKLSAGDVLRFENKMFPQEKVAQEIEIPAHAYELLQKNTGISIAKTDYLPWLSDYVQRKKYFGAKIFGIYDDGKLASSAMTLAETEKSALLGGVVTDKNYRKNHLATNVLYTLTDKLTQENKKEIFIYTYEVKNTVLYEKIGFRKIGEWGRTDRTIH